MSEWEKKSKISILVEDVATLELILGKRTPPGDADSAWENSTRHVFMKNRGKVIICLGKTGCGSSRGSIDETADTGCSMLRKQLNHAKSDKSWAYNVDSAACEVLARLGLVDRPKKLAYAEIDGHTPKYSDNGGLTVGCCLISFKQLSAIYAEAARMKGIVPDE